MWKCPNCGTENSNEFCGNCGEKKPQETIYNNQLDNNEDLKQTQQKNQQLKMWIIIVSVVAASLLIIILSFSIIRGIFYQNQKKMKMEFESQVTEEPLIPTQEPLAEPTMEPDNTPERVPVYESDPIREITYIGASRTPSGDTVTIMTTSRVTPNVQHLHNPERIVLDFPGFAQVVGGTNVGYSGGTFSNIRYANHDSYSRVVIDLFEDYYYTVDTYDNKCIVDIIE